MIHLMVVSAWLISSIILRRYYFDRLLKKLPPDAEASIQNNL